MTSNSARLLSLVLLIWICYLVVLVAKSCDRRRELEFQRTVYERIGR